MEFHTAPRQKASSYGRRFLLMLFPCAVLSGVYCLYTPLSVLSVGAASFSYTVADMFLYCLVLFLCYAAASALVTALLRGEGLDGVFVLLTGLSVASLVQRFWLNGELTEYLSNNIDWRSYRWPALWNLLIWAAIIAALYVAFRFLGKYRHKAFCGLCAALLVFLGVSTAAACLRDGQPEVARADCYCDATEMIDISAEENILLFVLDSVSLEDLEQVKDSYPNALSGFTGFVTYEQYQTDGDVPGMLLSDEASALHALLREQGYDKRLFDKFPTEHSYAELSERYDNIVPTPAKRSPSAVREAVMATAFYEDAPLLLKGVFRRSPKNRTDSTKLMYGVLSAPVWEWEGDELYSTLQEHDAASGEEVHGEAPEEEHGLFAVYRLQGGSEPYVLNDTAAYDTRSYLETSRLTQVYATLCIVGQMLETLREAGVYDTATVVVVGNGGSAGDAPLLMVKQSHADGAAVSVSADAVDDKQLLSMLEHAVSSAQRNGQALSGTGK